MRHRRHARHRPNYLLRLGVLAFLVAAYSAPHAAAEPAPEAAIWSPAPQEPTAEPTAEPSFREQPAGASEAIDCADEEDPDLCVELGDEYVP